MEVDPARMPEVMRKDRRMTPKMTQRKLNRWWNLLGKQHQLGRLRLQLGEVGLGRTCLSSLIHLDVLGRRSLNRCLVLDIRHI